MSIKPTKQVAYENFNEPDLKNQWPLLTVKALFSSEDFIEGYVALLKKIAKLERQIILRRKYNVWLTGKNAIITGSSKVLENPSPLQWLNKGPM